MLLVVNLDFFLLFLLLRKWEPVEKEPKFSARSDQYSSVAIFTDFANLSVKFPFSLIFLNYLNTVLLTFNSKLVGITDVASPEGRDMCAEVLRKLKVQCTSS